MDDGEPDDCTTFGIYLPRVPECSGEARAGNDAGNLPSGIECALLVEDESSG